jgi:hypothetical protein
VPAEKIWAKKPYLLLAIKSYKLCLRANMTEIYSSNRRFIASSSLFWNGRWQKGYDSFENVHLGMHCLLRIW